MFKLLGFLIKAVLFAGVVLVLGSVIHWKGKTVSDQVKTHLAHAERAGGLVGRAKNWGNELTATKKAGRHISAIQPSDEISSSERERLRELIHELNTRPNDRTANTARRRQ